MENNIDMFESFRQKRYAKLYEEEQQQEQSKEVKPLNLFGAISLLQTKPSNMMKVILSLTGSDLKSKFETPASLALINMLINAIGKNPTSKAGDAIQSIESSVKGDTLTVNIKGKEGSAMLEITKDMISKLGDSECILDMPVSPKEALPETVNVESKLGTFLLYTPQGSIKEDNVAGNYSSAFEFAKKATTGSFSESIKNDAFINDLNSAFKSNISSNKYLNVLKDISKYEDKDGFLKGSTKKDFIESLSKGSDMSSLIDMSSGGSKPDSGTTVATEE